MELKVFRLKIKETHYFVDAHFTPCQVLFPTCQAAGLDLSERSPGLPPTGQQLDFSLLMTGPVHFLMAFVRLCSSDGHNPRPALSENNGSRSSFFYSPDLTRGCVLEGEHLGTREPQAKN